MRCRRAASFTSRFRIQAKRYRNEMSVASRGPAAGYSCAWRSADGFRAELLHPSIRSEAGPACELSEFGADFRSDASWPVVSLISRCDRAGSGKQFGYRGVAISPANRADRHRARKGWRVTTAGEPVGERAASRTRRTERPAAYDSHRQFDTVSCGDHQSFGRRIDYAAAEQPIRDRRDSPVARSGDSTI